MEALVRPMVEPLAGEAAVVLRRDQEDEIDPADMLDGGLDFGALGFAVVADDNALGRAARVEEGRPPADHENRRGVVALVPIEMPDDLELGLGPVRDGEVDRKPFKERHRVLLISRGGSS